MPDPKLSPDDELAADIQAMTPDDELAADIQQFAAPGSQVSPEMQQAADYGSGVPEEVEQAPVYETKNQAIGDEPWYSKLYDTFKGKANPGATAAENVASSALGGTTDELGSAAIGAMSGDEGPVSKEYAAGSRFEDNRQTLEAEKLERDAQNPGSAVTGKLLGSAAQAAALPGAAWGAGAASKLAGAGASAATAAGLTGAQLMGEGHGDLAQRVGQAVDAVEEHPIATAAGVAVPALAAGAVRPAAKAAAGELETAAAKNTVSAFTTPAQRAALTENRGPDAITQLGQDVRARGLHKNGNPFVPANAETYYNNSRKLRDSSAEGMKNAENQIVDLADPPVNTGQIADELEQSADDVSGMWDQSAAKREAAFRREQAQGISPTKQVPGPVNADYQVEEQPFFSDGSSRNYTPSPQELSKYNRAQQSYDKAVTPPEMPQTVKYEGPWTPEVPAVAEKPVAPEQWYSYLNDVKKLPAGAPIPPAPQTVPGTPAVPPKGPGEILPSRAELESYSRGVDKANANQQNLTPPKKPEPGTFEGPDQPPDVSWTEHLPETYRPREAPFSEALKNRRYNDSNINYDARGGYEGAGMQEQVRRQVGAKTRGAIDDGLDAAVQRGEIPAELAAKWRADKKDFSVAASVHDPALAAMEKDYGGKSPLGLKDAAILQTFGPLASMGDKAMAGRWPTARANTQARLGSVASSVASDSNVGMVPNAAREQSAPDPEVVKQKNDSMKEKLRNWFDHLLE